MKCTCAQAKTVEPEFDDSVRLRVELDGNNDHPEASSLPEAHDTMGPYSVE
jgi:hypothetical protein